MNAEIVLVCPTCGNGTSTPAPLIEGQCLLCCEHCKEPMTVTVKVESGDTTED